MKKLYHLTVLVFALLLSVTLKAVPKLSSYPSASATIFLDFDGHYVNSGAWNGGTPFACDAAALSNAQITEVFNRMAEDFRPFDINITTDSAVFIAAPYNKRMRIIVTPTSNWYPGVGGVAWVGSFVWGDDTPAFVFSDKLGPNNPKPIAEACSHESGHALGLSHQSKYDGVDCSNPIETYNSGKGNGQAAWAPLMGNSYGRNMTNWNNGPTPYGCNSVQDNLSIISSINGFGYREDDYADATDASATALATGNFSVSGVISTNIDKDAFKLTLTQPALYHFTALPFSIAGSNEGADLDIKIDIYNSAGTLINSYNPSESLDIFIDTNLTAGTYYFVIDGVGNSNIGEYGSLGSYTFTGTNSALPIKDVALSGNSLNGKHNLNWNIITDDPIKNIIVERSSDAVHFKNVTEVLPAQRSTSLNSAYSKIIYYRLKVISVPGQIVFSNTIALKESAGANNIFSVSTFIQNEISVNASYPYQYQLYNSSGILLHTGTAKAGLNGIPMQSSPPGIYILKLNSENNYKTERIIKQ
jgi:hypothetical protein